MLFLHQAGVAGDALPAGVLKDPGIGEASQVLVRLALIGSFGVIDPGDYSRVFVQHNFDILNAQHARLELRIGDIGEKFSAFADLSVPLGVYEFVADHGGEGVGIAAHLGFIPQVLESYELLFARVRIIIRRLREDECASQQAKTDTNDKPPKHGRILAQSTVTCNAHRFDGEHALTYVTDVTGGRVERPSLLRLRDLSLCSPRAFLSDLCVNSFGTQSLRRNSAEIAKKNKLPKILAETQPAEVLKRFLRHTLAGHKHMKSFPHPCGSD